MSPNISTEINLAADLLQETNEVGIVLGNHQNNDTIAAALALYLSLSQTGKNVQIVSPKEAIVDSSNLVGIDKISSSFKGSGSKLVISLPYIKGEVEKVLFTEQPNRINFHLTAAQGKTITPFDINDVKLNWEGGSPRVLVAVGVGNIEDVSSMVSTDGAKVINIDNFPGNSRYGDVVVVDDGFSSVSEAVGKLIKDTNMPMDVDIAQNLLDGVMFATRGLTKGNISPAAFEVVSTAMYQGAQRRDVRSEDNTRNQRNFDQPKPRPDRVSDNDFPAMHMRQNQGGQNQNRFENRRQNQPSRGNQRDQRENRDQRESRDQRDSRPQFGQNKQDIQNLMNKIREEQNKKRNDNRENRQREDRMDNPPKQFAEEVVEEVKEPVMEQPRVQNEPMPFNENQDFSSQNDQDIPDDWLMPKVFKSSNDTN